MQGLGLPCLAGPPCLLAGVRGVPLEGRVVSEDREEGCGGRAGEPHRSVSAWVLTVLAGRERQRTEERAWSALPCLALPCLALPVFVVFLLGVVIRRGDTEEREEDRELQELRSVSDWFGDCSEREGFLCV